MSSQSGQKNIQSIRTFSADAARVQELKGLHESSRETKTPQFHQNVDPKEVKTLKSTVKESAPVRQESSLLQKKPTIKVEQKARIFVPKKHVDLSDEVASVSHETKTSILSDTDDTFRPSSRAGNIIRDTKRKRFRLFPAMLEAASLWFKTQKEAYDAYRHPNHTVTRAETRKKILQASVREDAQAPKEDFKDVATRMKNVERAEITSTLSFKEKSEVQAPTWTHVHEESEPLAVEDVPSVEEAEDIVLEVHEVKESPVITVQEPKVAPASEVVHADPVIPYVPQEESVDQHPTQAHDELPMTEVVKRMRETPAQLPQIEAIKDTQDHIEPQYQEEQKIPILYFIVVIVVASVLGIGLSYYFFVIKNAPTQQIVVEYIVPQLLSTSQQIPFRFGEDRRTSLGIIKDFVDRSQTITQLYPTVIDGHTERPAPVQTIINELELQAPGSFTRAITEFTFGGTPQRQPFIIMRVTSFDTAFAGILEWERTMSADLSPLFGDVVINSFDPSARTDTQVREAFFKDIIASNKNVRLLLDEEGKDRIVYTFTNQNTILITTTREALDEILPLVR